MFAMVRFQRWYFVCFGGVSLVCNAKIALYGDYGGLFHWYGISAWCCCSRRSVLVHLLISQRSNRKFDVSTFKFKINNSNMFNTIDKYRLYLSNVLKRNR